MTKKESDGVLPQMIWPPQSPDLNPIEMVWDELEHGVKENTFKTVGKAFQVKLVERMAKGGYFEVLFHSFDVFAILLQCRI